MLTSQIQGAISLSKTYYLEKDRVTFCHLVFVSPLKVIILLILSDTFLISCYYQIALFDFFPCFYMFFFLPCLFVFCSPGREIIYMLLLHGISLAAGNIFSANVGAELT